MCTKLSEEPLALDSFLFLPKRFLRLPGRFGRHLGLLRRRSPRRHQLLEVSVRMDTILEDTSERRIEKRNDAFQGALLQKQCCNSR
jgi:hypothetical protein